MTQPESEIEAIVLAKSGVQTSDVSVAELVAQVFEAAPAAERSRLLELLLRPLGALSLVTVAGGVFAKLRFRSGWQNLQVRVEDAQNVESSQVVALVNHVQQVSVESVDALAQLLAGSPVLASSAAAAILLSVLMQHGRLRSAVASRSDPLFPAANSARTAMPRGD